MFTPLTHHRSSLRHYAERKIRASNGEYLPLSVYAQRGFDVSRIAATFKNKEEHPHLGTAYRVAINSRADVAERCEKTMQKLLSRGDAVRRKAAKRMRV